MKNNQFIFEIYSSDGKKTSLEIEALYVNIPGYGVRGILKNHEKMIANLSISTIYVYTNNEKKYFALSGGILDVKKDKTIILADTYENRSEIDKDRALKAKEKAEKTLSELNKKDIDYELAELSLKKAINRLSIL